MKKSIGTITVQNKKYPYVLSLLNQEVTHVKCEAAKVDQDFLNQDIPALLVDLPNLILAEKDYNKGQDTVIRFRVKSTEKRKIEEKAMQEGYGSVSGFLRDLALS